MTVILRVVQHCAVMKHLSAQELFETFEAPLIFVPGDNEWTDCHRQNNGSYDPIERLEIFFKRSKPWKAKTTLNPPK